MIDPNNVQSAANGIAGWLRQHAAAGGEKLSLFVLGLENISRATCERRDVRRAVVRVTRREHKEQILGVGIGVNRRDELTRATGELALRMGVIVVTY